MATRIAELITQRLIKTHIIEEGDRELYRYGFYLLVTRFFFFSIAIITGFLVSNADKSMIFFLVFMTLRTYAGGVHARTETSCTVLTTLSLIVSVFIIKAMEVSNGKVIAALLFAAGSICVLLFAPLETKEKPLEYQERQHYRAICVMLVFLCGVGMTLSWMFSLNVVYYPTSCGMCLEGILLCIGKRCSCKD